VQRTIIGCIITYTLGCLGVAPLAAVAQPPAKVARIGYLSPLGAPRPVLAGDFWEAFLDGGAYLDAFVQCLGDLGYREGHNLVLEVRFAEGKLAQLPALVAELVQQQVDLIVTLGNAAPHAAKAAATTIPIVMVGADDPVGKEKTMWCSAIGCIVTLTLSMLAVPLAAVAQPAGKIPTIGFLNNNSAPAMAREFEAFTQGLRELGYIDGQTIAIEQRYAEGRVERLPALATELAALHVAVFVVNVNSVAEAVQQTTTQIPIVMIAAEEPVHFGLAKSLAHPGGNLTGVAVVPDAEIYGKILELLTAVLPPGARIGVLFDTTSAVNALWLHATEEAARALRVSLVPTGVRSVEDFEHAVAVMQQGNATGFVVLGGSTLLAGNRERINELAVRSRLASMWPSRQGVEAGGVMSYAATVRDRYHRAATYVDKILKGANPGDLPMEQPMKFELVINLKTAEALGLTIPPLLLFQADEVIR
jgi:putative ABC transport system substrate-binding protein